MSHIKFEMSMDEMKETLGQRASMVEDFLRNYPLGEKSVPDRLLQSMLYSLQAGGKRIRPVLCMSCAALLGMDMREVLPFAAALEMIHTYSLIHDDLPAMDNDDLRRGKPSNHKAFDEATAILAGDGLLTDAFAVACDTPLPASTLLAAICRMALAAGSAGMVGGQMLDMLYTRQINIKSDQLERMQALKTGAMLEASCVCGSMLANAQPRKLERIQEYGKALGRAFQIADDILDVTGNTATLGKPVGSDKENGKITWPSLIGLPESRRLAQREAEKAKEALNVFSGHEAAFLRSLAEYTVRRAV